MVNGVAVRPITEDVVEDEIGKLMMQVLDLDQIPAQCAPLR